MPATFEFIRALDDLSEEDARLAGLDGLSLREMNRDSRPISDGYVITTSAFDVFARSAELQATVTWFAERARTTALDEQARYSSMIEVVVRSAIVPEDLRDAILTNYWELRKKSGCVTVLAKTSFPAEVKSPGSRARDAPLWAHRRRGTPRGREEVLGLRVPARLAPCADQQHAKVSLIPCAVVVRAQASASGWPDLPGQSPEEPPHRWSTDLLRDFLSASEYHQRRGGRRGSQEDDGG